MSPIERSMPPQAHLPPLQEKFYAGSPQDVRHLLSSTSRELPFPRSPNPPTPTSQPDSPRYDPYQSTYLSQRPEIHVNNPSDQPHPRRPASTSPTIREAQRVTLPPARPSSSNHTVSLPSVADLVRFNATGDRDPPKTILERLKHGDSSVHHTLTTLAALLGSLILATDGVGWFYRSRPPNEGFVSRGPSSGPPLFLARSRGDLSHSAPAFANHDQHVYVTEGPQIHDLDHSSRFKSETRGEISDGGSPGKNESDFPRTADSDARSGDMPVRRPLRPW